MKELLKKYSNLIGVSGNEKNISKEIKNDLIDIDYQYTDSMGNIISIDYGTCDYTSKIMIAAHMDEIGLMVKYIDEKGFIYFEGLGGWNWQTLLSQQIIFDNSIIGVVGAKPPHVMSEYDRSMPADIKNMFIDVGASSKSQVEDMGITIGSTATFNTKFQSLDNEFVTGKALDNRVGVVTMIEVMKRINTLNTIYAVGTVQEEVGLKGAKVISERLQPDLAIVVDTCLSGDHPGFEWKEAGSASGNVSITIADGAGRGILVPKHIIDYVKKIADEYSIPIDFSVSNGGTTDGMATHGNGIPTIVVAIPTRYIHSPVEVLNMKDVENTIRLITELIDNW